MASRLSEVGVETGRRVARFMTRLPPPSTNVLRNDFSALGLQNGRQVEGNLDDAETASIFEGSSSYIHIQVGYKILYLCVCVCVRVCVRVFACVCVCVCASLCV